MKITHRLKAAAVTTLATAALAAVATGGITGTPSAQAAPPAPTPFRASTMVQQIDAQLAGKAVGYSFAITHNGKLVYNNGRGKARNNADGNRPMLATSRADIMSASKNFTAVTVLHLLHRVGLTPDTRARNFLPPDFTVDKSWDKITFKQLLTHTSGLGQQPTRLKFTEAQSKKWGTLYDGLKFAASKPIQLNSAYDYTNMNYAMLRLTITGLLRGTVDPVHKNDYPWSATGVTSINYLNKFFLEPMGISKARCGAQNEANAVLAYDKDKRSAKGQYVGLKGKDLEACAGHRGLWLSPLDMAKFRMHMVNDGGTYTFINDWQYDMKLGWETTRDGFAWHGGAYFGSGNIELRTCIAQFPDNVQAAIMVNTQTSPDACRVLVNAFKTASGR